MRLEPKCALSIGPRLTLVVALLQAPLAMGSPVASQESGARDDARARHPSLLSLPETQFQLPDPQTLRRQLSNGIPVYLFADSTVPLVDIAIVVSTGAIDDPIGSEGLAAFTGSMVRRAGAGELDADSFDEAVDLLGAELDSFGGTRRSGMSLSSSPHLLERALPLAVAALTRPRFDSDRLERARANLESGLEQRNDDPTAVADREWRILMLGENHPQTRALTGSSLVHLDRASVMDFHRRFWTPERVVIAASGDFENEALMRLLDQSLGHWQVEVASGQHGTTKDPTSELRRGTVESPHQDSVPDSHPDSYQGSVPVRSRSPARTVHQLDLETPQALVYLGHEGLYDPSFGDRERFVAIVLSEVLTGAGPVSRLRSALRAEQPIVYRVSGTLGIGAEEPGLFEVSLATEPELVTEALRRVVAEIERMRREPVPEVELALAKRVLLSGFPLLFESAERVAGLYAEDELLGRPHGYWQLYLDSVASVTAEEIRALARRALMPDRLEVLVVGPEDRLGLRQEHAAALRDAGFKRVVDLSRRDPIDLDPVSTPRSEKARRQQ